MLNGQSHLQAPPTQRGLPHQSVLAQAVETAGDGHPAERGVVVQICEERLGFSRRMAQPDEMDKQCCIRQWQSELPGYDGSHTERRPGRRPAGIDYAWILFVLVEGEVVHHKVRWTPPPPFCRPEQCVDVLPCVVSAVVAPHFGGRDAVVERGASGALPLS